MLNFCDFIQVYVFITNHHLNREVIAAYGILAEVKFSKKHYTVELS